MLKRVLFGILLIPVLLLSSTASCFGEVIEMSIKDMTHKADVILIGRVESVTHHLSTFEDIPKPFGALNVTVIPQMHRKVKVTVERYLKNPQDSSEVVIIVLGATIGKTTMWVEDQPSFENSERVLVFLKANPWFLQANPEDYYQVLGCFQGKFTIESGLAVNEGGQTIADGEVVEQVKFVLRPKSHTLIYMSILFCVVIGGSSLIIYYRKFRKRESIRLLDKVV